MGKHDVIRKTGSTLSIAMSSEEDRATTPDSMYRKFHEVWTCGFSDILADTQTDRHTSSPQYFAHLPAAK